MSNNKDSLFLFVIKTRNDNESELILLENISFRILIFKSVLTIGVFNKALKSLLSMHSLLIKSIST